MVKYLTICLLLLISIYARGSYIIIPMDEVQKNHLKAYGVAYWVLQSEVEVRWLLNYRGGSFMIKNNSLIENECIIRGVSYEMIADIQSTMILREIANPEVNMEIVKLEKAPKIAVYSPKEKRPWDDAVTLVLTYAEIPYDVVYDQEVIQGVFDELEYCWYENLLNAKDYGIPQNRERIFVVGFKKKREFSFPDPIPLTSTMQDLLQDNFDSNYVLGDTGVNFITSEKRPKNRY